MHLEAHELDRLLDSQLEMISSIVSPRKVQEILPAIYAVVERRLPQVETLTEVPGLILDAAHDEALWPLVAMAIEGDRNDFGNLWMRVQAKVLPVIRRTVGRYGDEFVDRALDQTWETLEKKLKDTDPEKTFNRDKGFFLTWARAIARLTAMSVRPRRKRRDEFESGFNLPNREAPNSACFNELLKLAQNAGDQPEPHKVIAFLYNQYLGWMPQRIAEERGKSRLSVMPVLLEQDVVAAFPSLDGFGELLAGLRSQVAEAGDKSLSDYCIGTRLETAISHWSTDWTRTVRNSLLQQGKKLLRLAAELKAPTHERLCFLWCRFLRVTPHRLCTLAEWLLPDLLAEFCKRFETMTALEAQQIRKATAPLRTEIEQMAPKSLGECARGDLVESIELWRNRIETMLVGPGRKEHVVAYSYLCGCLPNMPGKAKALPGRSL